MECWGNIYLVETTWWCCLWWLLGMLMYNVFPPLLGLETCCFCPIRPSQKFVCTTSSCILNWNSSKFACLLISIWIITCHIYILYRISSNLSMLAYYHLKICTSICVIGMHSFISFFRKFMFCRYTPDRSGKRLRWSGGADENRLVKNL